MKKLQTLISFLLIVNLICAQEETINLNGTLVMNSEEFQPFMSSQNYNSNYGIHGKLISKETDEASVRQLLGAEFIIMNYKSKIFMGIEKAVLDSCSIKSDSLKFKIYVRAKKFNKAITKVSCQIPLTDEIIKLKQNSIVVTEKYLMPMFIESQVEDFENVQGDFTFKNDLGTFKIKPHNNFIVDTEFFAFDGLTHIVQKENYEERSSQVNIDSFFLRPGLRCKTGYNKLY
ncbi:hypothetical protein SAMN04488009_2775 [Maribacter sedimenticola]|uniref:Uncharacterized protein n=1 Tax=Maribacter sedimenticola TaxID=228956 RepID=A0ABY1SJ08_9FLAO|nr:hypothetical protein [Maribacter sedimenticola]SNR60530.1 hypothetical protein SAMN04488009_2775 [Maribacter sedimenticola]